MLFPPMVGGIFYEHGHRLVAASVGLLTVILAVWLWRRERRPWVRRLGFLALGAVICQGILGGITVIFLLPIAVSVSHAGLAQIFFALTVAIAVFTSPWWHRARPTDEDGQAASLRRLSVATTSAIYAQTMLGALMRHTSSGLAIPDFPLMFGRLVPPVFTKAIAVHFAHRVGALVVAVMIVWLAGAVLRRRRLLPGLPPVALILVGLLAVQICLGAHTILSQRAVLPTTLHVAGGAATLAAALILTLGIHRRVPARAAREEAAPAGIAAAADRL
jgi:cytochrome c oxidase assembly protein subunit 15